MELKSFWAFQMVSKLKTKVRFNTGVKHCGEHWGGGKRGGFTMSSRFLWRLASISSIFCALVSWKVITLRHEWKQRHIWFVKKIVSSILLLFFSLDQCSGVLQCFPSGDSFYLQVTLSVYSTRHWLFWIVIFGCINNQVSIPHWWHWVTVGDNLNLEIDLKRGPLTDDKLWEQELVRRKGNLGETSNSVEVYFLPFQFLFNP